MFLYEQIGILAIAYRWMKKRAEFYFCTKASSTRPRKVLLGGTCFDYFISMGFFVRATDMIRDNSPDSTRSRAKSLKSHIASLRMFTTQNTMGHVRTRNARS